MEFEFDKEIDFLLQQTARGETVSAAENPKPEIRNPKLPHLDAEEISAFAENALPEKIRQSYVLHLADCERCRKDLSSLIVLNGDAKSEIIHAERPLAAEIVAPKIPWYRTLFAVPTLAYAMGALILVFSGIGIFTILQNNSRNSEVSQTSDKQSGGGKGMSSDGDAATQEVYSSNRMSSNTAANSAALTNSAAVSTNSATNAASPVSAANSNAMTTRRESNQSLKEETSDDKTLSKPGRAQEPTASATADAPPPPAPTENVFQVDGQEEKPLPSPAQNSGTQNQTAQNQTQITPDTRNVQRAPVPSAKARKQDDEDGELKKSIKDKSAETTVAGDKNFTRAGNVWTDSAYRGQATTNISRGTKEYKKLDSGLRGIVENLGGTVIVVWKEKAYRIQ